MNSFKQKKTIVEKQRKKGQKCRLYSAVSYIQAFWYWIEKDIRSSSCAFSSSWACVILCVKLIWCVPSAIREREREMSPARNLIMSSDTTSFPTYRRAFSQLTRLPLLSCQSSHRLQQNLVYFLTALSRVCFFPPLLCLQHDARRCPRDHVTVWSLRPRLNTARAPCTSVKMVISWPVVRATSPNAITETGLVFHPSAKKVSSLL